MSIKRDLNVGTTGVSALGQGGRILWYYFYNNATSVRFLKFYDKATAPVVGTDTPILTIPLPPTGGANCPQVNDLIFANGIGYGATQLVADADTTAPAANDVVINFIYRTGG